jgi:hypothetical protein
MDISRRKVALMGALALSALIALPAAATTITLASPGQMYWSNQYVGSSSGNTTTTATTPNGNDYALSVPGQYSFLDSFGKQTNTLTGPGTNSTVGPYAFQDTYKFSLSQAANGDALAVSLNLNAGPNAIFDISNLQFRLYEVPSSSAPYGLSIPANSTIVTKWMGTTGPSNGASIIANFSNIQSGTYFLDVAGIADGSGGGTYLGQLNLSAVPLPAAAWLMLSGLAGLIGFKRKRAA